MQLFRLASFQNGANIVVNELWNLSESAVEELKILQTVVLLLTSSSLIRGPPLAKVVLLKLIYFLSIVFLLKFCLFLSVLGSLFPPLLC